MKAWIVVQVLGLVAGLAAVGMTGIAQAVVLTGAVVAALGIIHAKAIMPALRFGRRVGRSVDVMLDSPARIDRLESSVRRMLAEPPEWALRSQREIAEVKQRLDTLEERVAATQEPVEAIVRDLGVEHRGHGEPPAAA